MPLAHTTDEKSVSWPVFKDEACQCSVPPHPSTSRTSPRSCRPASGCWCFTLVVRPTINVTGDDTQEEGRARKTWDWQKEVDSGLSSDAVWNTAMQQPLQIEGATTVAGFACKVKVSEASWGSKPASRSPNSESFLPSWTLFFLP